MYPKPLIMEYSVSIIFDRRGTASETRNGSVEICIYSKGKKKRYSTGVNIKKNEWKNGMVVNRLDAVKLNRTIQQKYQEATELMNVAQGELAVANKATMTELSFCDWLDKEVAERADIRETTRKQHVIMAKNVRASGLFHTFKDIDQTNILRWDNMLRKKLQNPESVRGYHKRLKPYLKKARLMRYLLFDPYEGITLQRGNSNTIKFITEEERTRIEGLPLSGGMAIVRDMFIFSCYTGLADSDLRKIKKSDLIEDNGKFFIVDKRQKTGSQYKLMLLPKAMEILERYDYTLNLMTNQKCNQFLKAIQVMAGVKTNLTMHVGRHTFATWALKKGVPIEVVSKMLAHADIQTTQIYAKILQEEVTKGFELLGS